MKKSELFHLLREPALAVAVQIGPNDIDAQFISKFMAMAAYRLDNKKVTEQDITEKNNPLGLTNPSTGEVLSFNTLEEAILHAVTQFKELWEEDKMDERYTSIKKSHNLQRFDKEFIVQNTSGPIVDLPEEKCEPSVDVYTVSNNTGDQIYNTADLTEAEEVKAENPGSVITNTRGRVINGTKLFNKPNLRNLSLIAGAAVECSGLHLYKNLKDTHPTRVITNGTYYLYDGIEKYGRYAICVSAGMGILGYVNAEELKSE